MIAFGLEANGRLRRRYLTLEDGFGAYKSEWMESGEGSQLSPTVFLVEQPAGSTLNTHFHRQNEFQVVVQGMGTLGPHPLRPYTVHYAGAYSGYGPIVAGPEGLSYFTIRATFDIGALNDKALMQRGPKRQEHPAPVEACAESRLQTLQVSESSELINRPGDALSSGLHRLPAGSSMALQPAPAGEGLFAMVIAGSAVVQGTTLRRWENVFLSCADTALRMYAGESGCEFLTMQMPRLDEAYRTSGTIPALHLPK